MANVNEKKTQTQSYIVAGSKVYQRTLIALFLGSFVTFADIYSTQPLIPLFSHEYNVLPATASLALSFTTGILAISLFINSIFSDRFKRKNIMALSLILTALLSISLSFCHSFSLILVIRAFEGAAVAGFPALAMGYINEEVHPGSLGRAMGVYVSGTSVGGMSGRIIIGVLTDYLGWQAAFMILGLISLIAGIIFIRLLPQSSHFIPQQVDTKMIRHKLAVTISNPALLVIYSFGFLLMGVFVTVYNYIGFPLAGAPYYLNQTLIGFIFIVYLTGTFSSAWMGKWADHYSRPVVMAFGIFLMLFGAGLTTLSPLIIKIIGLAVFTFGFFGCHSVASSWAGKLADWDKKNQASSFYLLFYYAGSSLVGSIGGIAWHKAGWTGVTFLVTALLVIALFLTMVMYRHKKTNG